MSIVYYQQSGVCSMRKMNKILLIAVPFFIASASFSQSIPRWKLADLKAALQNRKDPVVINFWATFCKPCIAELPHFQKMANQYKSKGVQLIMVSVDLRETYPAKIESFRKRLGLTSPVVFLDESNADVFCPAVDSSWSGAIPATIFLNNKTGYRKFFEAELTKEKFEAEIKKMLR